MTPGHDGGCRCTPCRDARSAYVTRTRTEQGLSPTITDPVALALIAQGVKATRESQQDAA